LSCYRPPQLLTVPEITSFPLSDIDHVILASDGILGRAQEQNKSWLGYHDAGFGPFASELRTPGVTSQRAQIAWECRCGLQDVHLNGLARLVKGRLAEASGENAQAAAENVVRQCRGLSSSDDTTVIYLRLTEPLAAMSL
jgi:hypothetical protein